MVENERVWRDLVKVDAYLWILFGIAVVAGIMEKFFGVFSGFTLLIGPLPAMGIYFAYLGVASSLIYGALSTRIDALAERYTVACREQAAAAPAPTPAMKVTNGKAAREAATTRASKPSGMRPVYASEADFRVVTPGEAKRRGRAAREVLGAVPG